LKSKVYEGRATEVKMPYNDLFDFRVVVNDTSLPEYQVGADVYVEANLHSTVSYCIEEEDESGCTQVKPRGLGPKIMRHPFHKNGDLFTAVPRNLES